ncbi:hypothetical protein [Corynebacterium sp.]|uniref:hypothetical protein n=1 Tax=Corynebacterium sp. TaxID=1720 RepID=UPI0026DD2A20|nr:hypothetical protein [Corynebacterium sp.]MDO5076480.1 hypothetical protein [Corynebacterium sp.]
MWGLAWLALGALLSVLLEVVYLGTWITVAGRPMAFPFTIPIAFLFTMVLSRTALLWTKRLSLAAIPLVAWMLGFFTLTFWVSFSGDILVGENPRSMLLLFAGMAGGGWPLLRAK